MSKDVNELGPQDWVNLIVVTRKGSSEDAAKKAIIELVKAGVHSGVHKLGDSISMKKVDAEWFLGAQKRAEPSMTNPLSLNMKPGAMQINPLSVTMEPGTAPPEESAPAVDPKKAKDKKGKKFGSGSKT